MKNNKELTPIMELIEMCKTLMENSTNKSVYETANLIKFRAEKELLPKEETMVVCSWIDGKENREFGDNVFDDAQDYYNTKYNNQIK